MLYSSIFASHVSEASTFEKQALDQHNEYRKIHEADPMELDDEMNKEAAEYAKIIAKKGTLEHSTGGKDGENLAMKCNTPNQPEEKGDFFTTMW